MNEGNKLKQEGKLFQAIQKYQDALKINPDHLITLNQLGEIYESKKEFEQAIYYYQRVAKLQPENLLIYMKLAKIMLEIEKIEEAISIYNKAIQLQPENSTTYRLLAVAQTQDGQIESAIVSYEKAIQINASQPAWVYRNLGNALTQQQKWKEAKANLIQALLINPNSHQVYQDLGKLFEQQGFLKEAKKCYQKILPPQILRKVRQGIVKDLKIASSQDTGNDISYIKVHSSQMFHLSKPITIDGVVPPFFQQEQANTSETFVAIVPDALALLSGNTNAIMTSDGYLIKDLSNGNFELIYLSKNLPPVREIEGTVCSLVTPGGPIYGHWMFDLLPRIELVRCAGINLDEVDFFVVNQYKRQYQIETLNQLGIPKDKIIESGRGVHIKAKKFICTSHPHPRHNSYIGKWVCDFLKQKFIISASSPHSKTPKRIYFSRKNASHRRVENEEEVLCLLEKYGFECILPESLSVIETASLISNAEAIIAPHGSGMLNMVFCQPGTKVIELFSSHLYRDCWVICNLCDCEYYSLYCSNAEDHNGDQKNTESIKNNKQDMIVNSDNLLSLIKIANLEN